jgi:hypothetical protein
MGSVTKAAGGVAAALLIQAGLAVAPSAANAQPVFDVPCSTTALVNAVNAANAAGEGTLRLARFCNYALTGSAETGTRGPDGLPIIRGNINLVGGPSTRISRFATAPAFRIAEVAAGAMFTVQNIFIAGGDAGQHTGGGILNARGTVDLSRVTVTDNQANNGAGVSNDSGRLILASTLITGNTATGGGGGGLYNDGSLTVSLSRVAGNHANTVGGGLYNGQGGDTNAFRSTFDTDTSGSAGGGVFNASDAHLVLTRTLTDRNTGSNGGGLFNAGMPNRVAMVRSQIIDNNPNNCVGCL